ncbi:hypothetical protein SOVF_175010 [Spinacia oleracea]|nr:hypothetical protein SOVF_175010 [Spinacia oleracea]
MNIPNSHIGRKGTDPLQHTHRSEDQLVAVNHAQNIRS